MLQFSINPLSYGLSFGIITLLVLPFLVTFMYFGICWFNWQFIELGASIHV